MAALPDGDDRTAAELLDDLRDAYLAAGLPLLPSGITIPVDELPTPCIGTEAEGRLGDVQSLALALSDRRTFLDFLDDELQGACATAHLAAIDDLMNLISSATSTRTDLIAWLYAAYSEFAAQPGSLTTFEETFQDVFDTLKGDGNLPVDSPLQDEKPPTLA